MDLEEERRIRPPGKELFLIERGILKDLLYDEEEIMIPEDCLEIGTAAFLNNLYIEKAIIPASTHTIADAAFSGCMYLNKLQLHDGLKSIEDDAFYMSGLENITLPESLTHIGISAFQNTNLKSIHIPGSIETISEFAFADNLELESVRLHEGICQIKIGAFKNCGALKEVYCPASLTEIADDAFDGCHVMCVVAPGEWLIYRQDLVDKIMYKFK